MTNYLDNLRENMKSMSIDELLDLDYEVRKDFEEHGKLYKRYGWEIINDAVYAIKEYIHTRI